MKLSPTRKRGRALPRKTRKTRRARPKPQSRATPPNIYVEVPGGSYQFGRGMAHAHLRNKRGYVYLCWREGDRVRNFYLGKAPRKSPTADLAGAGGRGARPGRAAAPIGRRP